MPDLLVYSDWRGGERPSLLGTLSAENVRGREVFSFAFDEGRVLRGGDVAAFDPDLSLCAGRQFPVRQTFGFFLDSCPDRWGRRLIRRREALRAAKAGETPRRLRELDFLSCRGESPTEDIHELWRRIVFSIAVGNTDDHLRNHGFLLGERGWRLSPAYDINPNPDTQGALSLCIDADDATADFSTALRVARDFRLSPSEADAELARIRENVSNWRAVAAAAGIPPRQIEYFRPAFNA